MCFNEFSASKYRWLPPGGRMHQRTTGRHINLYIIERLYKRIKLNHGLRGPENRLVESILIVAAQNGNAPKGTVWRVRYLPQKGTLIQGEVIGRTGDLRRAGQSVTGPPNGAGNQPSHHEKPLRIVEGLCRNCVSDRSSCGTVGAHGACAWQWSVLRRGWSAPGEFARLYP